MRTNLCKYLPVYLIASHCSHWLPKPWRTKVNLARFLSALLTNILDKLAKSFTCLSFKVVQLIVMSRWVVAFHHLASTSCSTTTTTTTNAAKLIRKYEWNMPVQVNKVCINLWHARSHCALAYLASHFGIFWFRVLDFEFSLLFLVFI